jgi:hypothetical protein
MVPTDLSVNLPTTKQVINAQTGLVGYVRGQSLSIQLQPVTVFTNRNLNKNLSIVGVTTLLRPYRLYEKVVLQSENFNGDYGILSIQYSGEWRGNEWYAHLRLQPSIKG